MIRLEEKQCGKGMGDKCGKGMGRMREVEGREEEG